MTADYHLAEVWRERKHRLSDKSHHHTAPFESSYAITNGWLNPLLNRTRFFRRLEGALRAFGIVPSRES